MINSLQRAYLKQVAIKYMPITIAVLLAFIAWSNYAYHGWKGLLGPLALCVAMIAYAVHLLQEGDETNKNIRQRLYEETTRANRLEMERHALEVEVDRLSRPPTAEDIRRAAEQLSDTQPSQELTATEERWPGVLMDVQSVNRPDAGLAKIGGKLSTSLRLIPKDPELKPLSHAGSINEQLDQIRANGGSGEVEIYPGVTVVIERPEVTLAKRIAAEAAKGPA